MHLWSMLAGCIGIGRRRVLTRQDVERWCHRLVDGGAYGQGYAGNRLSPPKSCCVEIVRKETRDGWRVTISLHFGREQRAAYRDVRQVSGFDKELDDRFRSSSFARFKI